MAVVQTQQLRREFAVPRGEPFVAVEGLTFAVEAGEVYGLLGANGAGKSTTMRMLATLTRPTSGTATVAGHDVTTDAPRVKANLGYLSASSGLPTRVSCREVLELFAGLHGLDDAAEAAQRAVERYGIAEFAERRIETLSTGMRQRVRIAAAAVHEPPVLIFDEPTAGLDLVAADRLLDSILEARDRGTAVIFSTHVLREVVKICDRVGIIDHGRLVAEGTIDALVAEAGADSFEAAFLGLIGG